MFIHVSCNTLLNSIGSLLLDFDMVFILIFHFWMTSLIWCRGDITLMFPPLLKRANNSHPKAPNYSLLLGPCPFLQVIILVHPFFVFVLTIKPSSKFLNIFVTYYNAPALSTILFLGDHHILCNWVT
jgi:hypothetical protein